ncbi:DUF6056 family protein [Dysgonomonas sp. ZJ279]|uniref:DUF3329 domain-containing protein n=1 Tax=Dysgonomonas sp. ZJ279 TaxID=2709796 RepID=UPI001C86D150|nr:DUF6056 family protein [Dysgonomonas sp. ZJ279]
MNVVLQCCNNLYNKFCSEKIQKWLLLVTACLVFIFVFVLNTLYPMYFDDRIYSILKHGDTLIFPETFIDILKYQYHHYFEWGGRTVAHTILQILLLFDPLWQDIINSIVFVSFVFLLYKISNKNRSNNLFVFLLIGLSIFYFTPRFTTDVLWMSGTANYLWTTFIIFLFIYPYYIYSIDKETKENVSKTIFFLLGGVIAGWTNENMGSTMVLILVAYCFYYKRNKLKIPRWAISGIIGACIGCTLMILAPGNLVRAALEPKMMGMDAYNQLPFFDRIFTKVGVLLSTHYIEYILPLIIIYLILLILFLYKEKENKNRKAVLFNSVLFFIAGEVALFVTILSPMFPIRAYFGIIIFKIISISVLYANISLKSVFFRLSNILLFTILILACSLSYYRTYNALSLFSRTYNQREKSIIEQKEKGIEDIVVTTNKIALDYQFEYLENVIHWSEYYQVRSIKLRYENE